MDEKNRFEEIKMVAEWMELEGQHEEWCGNNILVDDEYAENGKTMIPYEPDKNWNQLMPVVEKIKTILVDSSNETRNKARKETIITHYSIMTPINEVYESVIEFINWHNADKK